MSRQELNVINRTTCLYNGPCLPSVGVLQALNFDNTGETKSLSLFSQSMCNGPMLEATFIFLVGLRRAGNYGFHCHNYLYINVRTYIVYQFLNKPRASSGPAAAQQPLLLDCCPQWARLRNRCDASTMSKATSTVFTGRSGIALTSLSFSRSVQQYWHAIGCVANFLLALSAQVPDPRAVQ